MLGIAFYIIGVVATNAFLEPLPQGFFFHPGIELVLISLGVFVLSSFFYGKLAHVLLLFAGLYLGNQLNANPAFVVLSLMPLLLALLGGNHMGNTALLDLRGKDNFFEEKNSYIAYIIAIAFSAAIIGLIFGSGTPF